MDLSADELAGLVDLFGALTRDELHTAAAELAFKRDGEFEPDAFATDVEGAVRSYHLLAVEEEAVTVPVDSPTDGPDDSHEGTYVVVGPAAFPTLPEDAGDLPHILDVGDRLVDDSVVAQSAEERFRRDAARAAESDDADRIVELLDVSYELEAWGPVDLGPARDRLDAVSE